MLQLSWRLVAQSGAVLRHCQGCGRTVAFRNSQKIRRNANGTTIHQFEIYKCEQDHTWNRKVPVTPADSDQIEEEPEAHTNDRITLEALPHGEGLEIQLECVSGRWRLDKTLADHADGLSRNQVAARIEGRRILVNGQPAECRRRLKSGDRILLLPEPRTVP